LDLGDYFLPHFREVFNYYLFKPGGNGKTYLK